MAFPWVGVPREVAEEAAWRAANDRAARLFEVEADDVVFDTVLDEGVIDRIMHWLGLL